MMGIESCKTAVMAIVNLTPKGKAEHLWSLRQTLKSTYTTEEIFEAVKQLVEEGYLHIYASFGIHKVNTLVPAEFKTRALERLQHFKNRYHALS